MTPRERSPRRVRLVRGVKLPDGVVSVARPSRWGNPWKVGSECQISGSQFGNAGAYDRRALAFDLVLPGGVTAEMAVALYRDDLVRAVRDRDPSFPYDGGIVEMLGQLRGKDLACYCDLDAPCHADVLLDLANR